jgi:hypothetical protein
VEEQARSSDITGSCITGNDVIEKNVTGSCITGNAIIGSGEPEMT